MPRKEYRKKIPIEKTRRGSLWTGSCWSLYEGNRAVILIGEDHQGHWTNTPEALKDVEEVVNSINSKQKSSTIKIWYEGDYQSDSFKSFLNWFKFEFNDAIQINCWEPPKSILKKEELQVIDLFGGDALNLQRNLGVGGIFLQKLIKADIGTEEEILNIINMSKNSEEYIKILRQPVSTASLQKWFTLGSKEVFSDKSSQLYKLDQAGNLKREKGLSDCMTKNNGIFLVGDSHIESMNRRNLLR